MTHSETEKRQVFLACKEIFTGSNAGLRKRKTIRKHITDHQDTLSTSIPNFDIQRIAKIVEDLLQKQVFELDVNAKTEFPDLFAPSPTKQTQHDVSETEAARSAEHALEEINSIYERQKENDRELDPTVLLPVETEAPVEAQAQVNGETALAVKPRLSIPSLYPPYFPYSAQHSILTTAQQVLEECCFEFTKKWLPSEVEKHEWDCAAAMELTEWTKFLAKRSSQLPDDSLQLRGLELDALLLTVRRIRHTAVHRLPTTARGVCSLVLEAVKLAETLQDTLRTSQLEELYLDIHNKAQAMELNKNALEYNFAHELEAIQHQREELDRKEEKLKTSTIESDKENKIRTGLLVKESIGKIFIEKTAPDIDSIGFETADDGSENE